jgi:drug/metabolite transporter (DMT)-like permease
VKADTSKDVPLPARKAKASFLEYSFPALAQMGASYSGNRALVYIDVPTKILAKTLKPVPVMIMGVLFRKNRHHPLRYIGVLFITIGIAVFFWLGIEQSHSKEEKLFSVIGIALAGVSLFLDGFIATSQESLIHKYEPSSNELMFSINLWQLLGGLVAMFVVGEMSDAQAFLARHPDVLFEVLLVSFYSAMGQLFIFLTIERFGPLTNSILTTMRKFLTIVANTFWYGHEMGVLKWASVGVVLLGVIIERYSDGLEKAQKKTKTPREVIDKNTDDRDRKNE